MMQREKDVTPFGTVTSDHLIYIVRRGWFGEKSQHDIPLCHVTGAELETRRHPILGSLLVLVGLACQAVDPLGILIAIVPLTLAVLLLWGSPSVRVNTADGDLPPARGLPWTRPEAEWFVAAVNRRRHRCIH